MHHFDTAAGETKGHGPERTLPSPVDELVEGSPRELLGLCISISTGRGVLQDIFYGLGEGLRFD